MSLIDQMADFIKQADEAELNQVSRIILCRQKELILARVKDISALELEGETIKFYNQYGRVQAVRFVREWGLQNKSDVLGSLSAAKNYVESVMEDSITKKKEKGKEKKPVSSYPYDNCRYCGADVYYQTYKENIYLQRGALCNDCAKGIERNLP